jgi:5-methylcytosine-specific restriction endonuclease McrA
MRKCWKCKRFLSKLVRTFYKHRSGRMEKSGICIFCSNGDQQVTRHKRHFGTTFEFPYEGWRAKIDAAKGVCPKCKKAAFPLSIDHVHPFSKFGGLEIENLEPLCRSCNARKNNRCQPLTITCVPFEESKHQLAPKPRAEMGELPQGK